ncbi:MAG TPA: HAD hydrolase-like protein, partial [Acidimicrobiales bacterium]|nr:HAD hydrolase-like protein [Acidimicrobiales bacterium]
AGRTDIEIARMILLRSGVSADRIDERLDDLRAATCAEYGRLCPPSLADKVVPGIVQLLDGLAPRPDVVLSLVTGNLEPVARIKLERAGLGRYFPAHQGGFGSDSDDRLDLPPIARRRAGRLLASDDQRDGDGAYPRGRTLVVGDTPRDIACARADGLRCLAVTTGPYRAPDLAEADAVAEDVHALEALIEAELERGTPQAERTSRL